MSNKIFQNVPITASLGAIGVIGIIGIALLFPSYKAISPMLKAGRNGSIDGYKTRLISSESMLPTLEIGDRILIDRRAYKNASPQRGDIIIFYPTRALIKKGYKTPFIQRIVGLPEETIEIKDGKVYINDEPLEEEYTFALPKYTAPLIQIPPRSYYVLGDHRNNSFDSHNWGYITEDLITGKVTSIFFPLFKSRNFD